jgi:hypothetical protein
METPAPVPVVTNEGISIYRLIGIVVAFVIFASLMSFSENLFNIDLKKYFYDFYYYYYPIKSLTTEEKETTVIEETDTNYGPAPVPTQSLETSSDVTTHKEPSADSAEQFWCFVGEDMVGRWCVQVLSPNMCPSERTYANKNACEMFKSN